MEAHDARLALVGEVLATISYKPSASFRWSGSELEITDAYLDVHSLECKEFTWCAGPPPDCIFEAQDPESAAALVFDWVFENVALAELHEVAEFLMLNGARVHDPHANVYKDGCPVQVGFAFPSGYQKELEYIP